MMTIAQVFEITYQKVMKARIVRKGRQDGGERRSKHLWLCIFMKYSTCSWNSYTAFYYILLIVSPW